jgi:MFS family permease
MKLAGRSLVAAMCLGQLGNLLPHVAVPAVMPQHLMPGWGLSGAEAGMMASAFAFGYMFAVPFLTTLTDRIDARSILLVGSIASALATLAFGLFANGLWSATLIWGLVGVGFAGAYMPGLKALTDRLPRGDVSRSVTLYTSSFSVGVGLSFLPRRDEVPECHQPGANAVKLEAMRTITKDVAHGRTVVQHRPEIQ